MAPEPAGPAALFEPAKVPAKGRASSLLRVSRPGRYALLVKSESGTAIQLIDRLGGPGEVTGIAGERDGRLDVFLESGEYLLRTVGDPAAKGEAELRVVPFRALVEGELQLPELREMETELGDFEERSYWFELKESRMFTFEAAGRHLTDVSLWRDGGWLVDAAAKTSDIEPRPGRPLRLLQLEKQLEAGLYRISLAGGPSLPWPDDDGTHPVVFRRGLPTLGEAGRQRLQLGLFGFVRYLIPRSTTFLRLELPGRNLPLGKSVALDYIEWEEGNSFPESTGWLELTKESTIPVIEGYLDSQNRGYRLVTISGTTGETLLFQHFNNERVRTFQDSGRYWIATLHSGDAADRLDASAVMTRRERGWTSTPVPLEAMAADVVQLGPGVERRRKVSITGTSELFFYVTTLGEYEFSMPKTALRVMPLRPTWSYSSASPPYGNNVSVPYKEGSGRFKLDPGYYVLQLEPREQDVVELHIRALDGGPKKPLIAAPHGMGYLGERNLETRYDYTIFINAEPGVEAGLVLRNLPIDPIRPLPLEVGQVPIEVPIQIFERGVLRARAEDDSQTVLFIDGKAMPGSTWLDPGQYKVGVGRLAAAPRPLMVSLSFDPASRVIEEPLPELPLEAITKLPIYPQLDDREERFFDLERGGTRTFLVRADEPALYRLESSGLLATEGSLRTALRPRLDAASSGGSGRNFLLQQYLRPGDYQLSAKALGRSAGHLGVRLSRSPVRDGGVLVPGVPARSDLPAGEAIAYQLKVPAAGNYRVRSLGLGRPFRIRLDEKGGWPLMAPGSPGDVTLELAAGDYQLIVLPQAVSGRVITRFDPSKQEAPHSGHGPFPLAFDTPAKNRWLEPAEGEERRPDVWTFKLPAPAEVTARLDGEMRAEIFHRGGAKAADVPPARAFRGNLPAGDYELRASCSRLNSWVDYQLEVSLKQLVAGESRRVAVPSSLELSLGEESLAEISSFGQVDVRARLYDAAGREVARFDDRPGDWNFSYTGRLAAGLYRLQVDPVSQKGDTEVLLRLPKETLQPAPSWPLARKLKMAAGVEVFPLSLPAGAEVLAFAADAPGNVRLALEAAGKGGAFRELASREGRSPRLLAWLESGVSYRLRVESLSHGELEVSLSGVARPLGAVSEKALRAGAKPQAVAGLPADFGILAAAFDAPGCFTVAGGAPQLAASLAGRAAVPLAAGQKILGAPSGSMLLQGDPRSAIKLERWRIADGESTFFLPAEGLAVCDLPAVKGESLRLLQASALAGQPSLAPGTESGMAQAVAVGRATTLVSSAATVLTLRGDGGAPLRLLSRSFKAPAEQPLGNAGGEAELAAGGTLAWRLPAGGKALRLLLDPGLVASLEGGGEGRRVWSAEAAAVDVSLEGRFDKLVVVNAAAAPGRLGLELMPLGAAAAGPTPGQPFERRVARRGQIELAVGGGAAELHVRGARGSQLLGADGSVAEGDDLPLPAAGGRLLVDADPGLLWIWLDQGDGGLGGLWPQQLAAGRRLELPALAELGAGVEVFDFEFPAATLLHLRGNGAGVVAYEGGGGGGLEVSAHAEAIAADIYLPSGRGRVAVRGAGGLAGGLLEVRSSPVDSAGEGLGPSFLLGPGQARYVAFKVPAAGKIGWAARAESGVADGRLLRADGREIARGGAGFLDLPAGEYLLGLSIPAEGKPTRVRAALVGLVPRGDLPPQELIAQYAAGTVPLPGEQQVQEEASPAGADNAEAGDDGGSCEEEDCGGEEGGDESGEDESGEEEGGGEEGGGR